MIRAFLIGFLSLALTAPAYAQSQSTDGSIEGTVVDVGGVLPGVTVTLTNVATVLNASLSPTRADCIERCCSGWGMRIKAN